MKRILAVFGGAILISACSARPTSTTAQPGASESEVAPFLGPSGLEQESEQAALDFLEAQRLAAEAAAEAQRVADEAAAAEAQRVADEAAAAETAERAAEEAGDDPNYEESPLESACSDGTASVEECHGPGSDVNGNGVADVNENGRPPIPARFSMSISATQPALDT